MRDDKGVVRSPVGIRNRGMRIFPASPADAHYADDLRRYLDRLLDDALEEPLPSTDRPAVSTCGEGERR
jgi:hypothetical protein